MACLSAEYYLAKLKIPIDDATICECQNALAFFKKYDGDKSDTLSRDEMRKMLEDHGRGDLNTVKRYFDYCDINEDGVITREEFIKATVGITMTDCWKRVFNEFDKDKNGFIDEKELALVFESLRMQDQNVDAIRSFIKCHDLDNDGRINYKEFLTLIVKCSREDLNIQQSLFKDV